MGKEKIPPNAPCPCGSGKKYKRCCNNRDIYKRVVAKRACDVLVNADLQRALEHHQAGHLAEAAPIYQQVLAVEPNNPDALHLLGLLLHQTGKSEAGIPLISKAISLVPTGPMYNSMGNALKALGRLNEAVAAYRQGINIEPDIAELHNNLGYALNAQNKNSG